MNPEVAKRIQICKSCENLTVVHVCTQCGCLMPAKVRIKSATCPIGKWEAVEIPPKPFPSWLYVVSTNSWNPPVRIPDSDFGYTWNEEDIRWVPILKQDGTQITHAELVEQARAAAD